MKDYLIFAGGESTGERCVKVKFTRYGIWGKSDESSDDVKYWNFYPYHIVTQVMKVVGK